MGTQIVKTDKEKMKLTLALLSAIAESKPPGWVPKGNKPQLPGSDSKANSDLHYVPVLECSVDLFSSSVAAGGNSGFVSMTGHGDDDHCYVNLGEQCSSGGVEVSISHMSIETAYGYNYDYYDYNCYDAFFFAHTVNGKEHKTDQQCGCLEGESCKYTHTSQYSGNTQSWDVYETELPTSYTLKGDDAKLVFHSDSSVNAGELIVDWKCSGNWDICPSKKCYTQDKGWLKGVDVTCSMTNPDCLDVTCSSDSIQASFDADLFHTNLENTASFMEQLESGHRELWYNGNKLEVNAPCGFTLTSTGFEINWSYKRCNITPSMNADEEIVYSVSLSSPGNAPGYDDIEFYVDTDVEASCAYDSKVVVNAEGFWVNQEDVEAAGDAKGKLGGTFDCKFFDDEARNNQILGENIVNMGEMIYGQVTSTALNGLSYELVGVTVTNANNLAMSFPVIDGGVPNSDVRASSDGSAETGQSVNFSYLSFGFESETGTNQNEINIECAVDLFVSIEETTTTTTTTTDPPTTYSEWKTHDIEYNPCNHDPNANCVTQCDDNGNCYLINLNE